MLGSLVLGVLWLAGARAESFGFDRTELMVKGLFKLTIHNT
jgi:hypothetical protein